MALSKVKLGELIEQSDERNAELAYDLSAVRGISIKKIFIDTKADMEGVSLRPYKLVVPDSFAYVTVTSRNGEKITLAHNDTKNTYIVSSSYIVFKVKRKDLLLSDFLFIIFNREEFDRCSRFNSWGSARETFSWEEMCDIDVELPSLEVQQKYVNVYLAMLANQRAYEKRLDDLKLVCDAYIEDLRRKMPCEEIGKYICERNERNTNYSFSNVQGVNSSSCFGKTKADTDGLDFHNYKIVREKDFAYNPSRINLGSIAMRKKTDESCIVSPMYIVFYVVEKEKLLPEYLALWLNRKEFFRSTSFFVTGSVRDTFSFSTMQEVKIPIPSLEVQKSIAELYKVYNQRKEINEKLKEQIKNLCPILIRGAINS